MVNTLQGLGLSFVVLLALAPDRASAGAVTYFRSDGGVAPSTVGPLPSDLGTPNVLRWRTEIDAGHSTPVSTDRLVFVTTYRPDNQELATVALDQESGQIIWKQVAPAGKIEQYHRGNGSPAAATPAWDGERLYVFFGSCGLLCYGRDGRKLWEQRLGPFQDEYGASSSPVLVDDKLILSEDHDLHSSLLAFDRSSGRPLWKVARPDAVRSYSTPALWTHRGRQELLVAGALELASYDPNSGSKLWWVHGLARIVIPVPVVSEETIYIASWTPGGDAGKRLALDPWPVALGKWDRNHDGKLTKAEITDPEVLDRFVRMDLDQSGDLDQQEWERHAEVFRRAQNALLAVHPSGQGDQTTNAVLWKYQRGIPYVATPLVHHGIVWMVKDGGIVTKLDAASGRLLQEERLPALGGYFASPVAGDGKVYFASESGTVSIMSEETEWRVLSSHEFHEKIYATPVLDHGRIFVRTEKALYCFSSQPRN